MWGFNAGEAEIMLGQHSQHQAGPVECWEARGMGPGVKVSPVAQKQLRAASARSFRQLVTSRLTTPH